MAEKKQHFIATPNSISSIFLSNSSLQRIANCLIYTRPSMGANLVKGIDPRGGCLIADSCLHFDCGADDKLKK